MTHASSTPSSPALLSSAVERDFRSQQVQVRRSRYRSGHWAEVLAAWFLRLKGYQILARRKKTRSGEIDLIALRGRTLVFVEVKKRGDIETARWSITPQQSYRTRCAAEIWLKSSPRYRDYHQRYDAMLVVPGRWPVHVIDGA